MEHEPTIDKANEIVENYLAKKLRENEERVLSLPENTPVDEVQDILKETNSYISFVADNCKELYESYRYRLLKTNDGYLIVQGEELDTDPEGGL